MFDCEQFGLDTEGHHRPILCSRSGHHMLDRHFRERTIRIPATFAPCATNVLDEFIGFRVSPSCPSFLDIL